MKKFFLAAGCLAVATAMGVIWGVVTLNRYAARPIPGPVGPVTVTIKPGQGFSEVVQTLSEARVIAQPLKFRLLARFKGWDRKIQAGKYRIAKPTTPLQLLETLVQGRVHLGRITIPEGYTVDQIAALIRESEFSAASHITAVCTAGDLYDRYRIEGATCEGYLFPDTYFFPDGVTAETIVDTMVANFWKVFQTQWIQRAHELDLSVHQVVTLASIIEKETGAGEERTLISSVFHNRLRRGMRLESDPTVIYGLQNFDGNLTRKHLQTPTPYNTYTNRGLPPGPIANPGRAALAAALNPADTPYLFFVAKKNGLHHFSKDLKEHTRAVNKYQLGR
jgi:UPF0755 protein